MLRKFSCWYTQNFPKVEPIKINVLTNENNLNIELQKCRELMEKCEEKFKNIK